MYTLFMVILISQGSSSTGGPIIRDGFKTEAACYAYAEKLKKTLKPRYDRGGLQDTRNSIEQIDCVKMD